MKVHIKSKDLKATYLKQKKKILFFIKNMEKDFDRLNTNLKCKSQLIFFLENRVYYETVASGNGSVPSWDPEKSIPCTGTWEIAVRPGVFRWKYKAATASHLRLSCSGKSPTMSSARPEQKLVFRVSVSF